MLIRARESRGGDPDLSAARGFDAGGWGDSEGHGLVDDSLDIGIGKSRDEGEGTGLGEGR